MKCKDVQKNINGFLRGTLTGNDLRRTYYHIEKCKDCKEILLDEFSFYTTFNDLDNDLSFNYKKKLDEFLVDTKTKIKERDYSLLNRYVIYTVIICMACIVVLIVAIRFVYA